VQEKLLAETAHIPCETTNLAVAGTAPVRLQIALGRRGDAEVRSAQAVLAAAPPEADGTVVRGAPLHGSRDSLSE
jgi:hypothetical protein